MYPPRPVPISGYLKGKICPLDTNCIVFQGSEWCLWNSGMCVRISSWLPCHQCYGLCWINEFQFVEVGFLVAGVFLSPPCIPGFFQSVHHGLPSFYWTHLAKILPWFGNADWFQVLRMGNKVFISIWTNICTSLSEGNSVLPNRTWAKSPLLHFACGTSILFFLFYIGHACPPMIHVPSSSVLLSSMTSHHIVGVMTGSRYSVEFCFDNRLAEALL